MLVRVVYTNLKSVRDGGNGSLGCDINRNSSLVHFTMGSARVPYFADTSSYTVDLCQIIGID